MQYKDKDDIVIKHTCALQIKILLVQSSVLLTTVINDGHSITDMMYWSQFTTKEGNKSPTLDKALVSVE